MNPRDIAFGGEIDNSQAPFVADFDVRGLPDGEYQLQLWPVDMPPRNWWHTLRRLFGWIDPPTYVSPTMKMIDGKGAFPDVALPPHKVRPVIRRIR